MTSLVLWIREIVLLTNAREVVAKRPKDEHEVVRHWWLAAQSRLRVAERLDPRTELAAALPLYREGVAALAAAAVAAVEGKVGADDTADVESAWRALERVWSKLDAGVPLTTFEPARTWLHEKRALDAPSSNATVACRSIDRLTGLIERRIEPRTARDLRWRRIARMSAIVGLPLAVAAWTLQPLFRDKGIALYKPVRLSSSHPDSMAPASGEGLVNGRIERSYGAHTNTEDNPWMMVDLVEPTPVKRIVIYNRGDGWFGESLPLVAQVGVSEAALHEIAVRDNVFTQHNPWTINVNENVRFVRLMKKGHGSFALSEIAVYR